jgi:hypothetical protein
MDPTGSIADAAGVGAVVGSTLALLLRREEELAEWTARGMVCGGALGLLTVIARAVL